MDDAQIKFATSGPPAVLSVEALDLAVRYLELTSVRNPDPDTYPSMLESLAADFIDTYGPGSFVAANLRQRAAWMRALGAF
jgi:hypothetical protein